jgi:hypothetical protein
MYTRTIDELNPFKAHMLEQEDPKVRRLAWICQIKRSMLPGELRNEYNAKRDEQLKIIKQDGNITDIYALADKYEFFNELVTS